MERLSKKELINPVLNLHRSEWTLRTSSKPQAANCKA